MFLRYKKLLTMINALQLEQITIKARISELEEINNRKINLTIDGNEIGKIAADKIYLDNKIPVLAMDENGIKVNGKITIKGKENEILTKGGIINEAK